MLPVARHIEPCIHCLHHHGNNGSVHFLLKVYMLLYLVTSPGVHACILIDVRIKLIYCLIYTHVQPDHVAYKIIVTW